MGSGYKVFVQLLAGTGIGIRQVSDDLPLFQQGDACGDVYGMGKIMAGDENGGSRLMIIVGEDMLQDVLRRGIEKIEGLVEDNQLRAHDEG